MQPFWRPPPFCFILNPLFSVVPAAGFEGQSRPQADAGFSTSNPKKQCYVIGPGCVVVEVLLKESCDHDHTHEAASDEQL